MEATRGAFLQVCHLHAFFNHSDPAVVTFASMTPRLEYCHSYCVGLPMKTLLAQDAAAS